MAKKPAFEGSPKDMKQDKAGQSAGAAKVAKGKPGVKGKPANPFKTFK